jgi:putative ABC transport system permease protein
VNAVLSAWLVNIPIAFTALRTNLMRSILTTLGVMIGVLAVTLAVAIGEGAKSSILESVSAFGQNMAFILPVPDSGKNGPPRSQDRGRLTERDARVLSKQVPGVTAVAPQLRSTVQFVVGSRNATTMTVGITPEFGIVSDIRAETGRFITDSDVRTGARVVVLGPSVAQKLFKNFDPIGQQVRMNKVPLTVIGILESKGSSFGNDNDDTAVVPLTMARQRFSTTTATGPDDLSAVFIGFENAEDLVRGKKEIIRLLRARYRVPVGQLSPFTVRTTEEFVEQTGQVAVILQAVLVGIASISLLVGGIGIMNIMLVSVTERTREIGLRMAIGARRRDIRNQFLVEAAVLCVIGGSIGLSLAVGIAWAVRTFADFPVSVGPGVGIFAILFSAAIGLVFGGYPAIRASRLSPIEALRSE